MTKITIQLSRNIGFYYSMLYIWGVYKRVDTYDLDTLSDNVVNKLAVGERTKVISFTEGKESTNKTIMNVVKQLLIDLLKNILAVMLQLLKWKMFQLNLNRLK